MTDKKTEALKLALETLENAQANVGNWWPDEITAIREALAEDSSVTEQPAQQYNATSDPQLMEMPKIGCVNHDCDKCKAQQHEPVAWRVKVETKLRDGSVNVGYQLRNERLSEYDEPLYTSPPASKPLPEHYTVLEQALTRLQKRYADLEGKVGKPLTKEEIIKAQRSVDPEGQDLCGWSFTEGIRWAENYHDIKGGA